MNSIIRFLIGPVLRRYEALLLRVTNLETAWDCLVESPQYVDAPDVGFNGQQHRKLIFRELLNSFHFEAILETGTWIGNTTGYLARAANLPVYTCELNQRFHALAKMRLQGVPNVVFERSDSREFLKKIAGTAVVNQAVFIYLDAHWYDDLPLQQELEIICNHWKSFVIMIDDFQVPGDAGYGYDDYGGKKALAVRELGPTFTRFDLVPFFPALPSAQETGFRRGCVVLGRRGEYAEKLGALAVLVRR